MQNDRFKIDIANEVHEIGANYKSIENIVQLA